MSDPYDLSGAKKPQQSASPASPGIIVDSDWKQQAQAEKEKLSAEERKREEKGDRGGPRTGAPGEMPPADFRTLLGSLATQALLYLGAIPDPETGRAIVSLEYGRHYIDLLAVLEAKTKGNLEPDESAELTELLAELRTRFVQISRTVATAMAERAATGGAGLKPPSPKLST